MTAEELVEAFNALRQTNPELANFYRNQQRFVHLYALARGASITAAAIERMVQALDPERTFSTHTYYQLRRDLQDGGWIEAPQTPGREENPHTIREGKLDEFRQVTRDNNLVERPVVLNKYRLFDTGLRLVTLAQNKADPNLVTQISTELEMIGKEDKGLTFYPGFSLWQFTHLLIDLASQRVPLQAAPPNRPAVGALSPPSNYPREWVLDTTSGRVEEVQTGSSMNQWIKRWYRKIAIPPLEILPPETTTSMDRVRGDGQSRISSRLSSVHDNKPIFFKLIVRQMSASEPLLIRINTTLASLANGTLNYGWGNQALSSEPLRQTKHNEWEAEVRTPPISAASPLSGLSLSLVGSVGSSSLFSVVVEDSQDALSLIVTSHNTGIRGEIMGFWFADDREPKVEIPADAPEDWQVELNIQQPPRKPGFDLWFT